jgi:hypothetical protein
MVLVGWVAQSWLCAAFKGLRLEDRSATKEKASSFQQAENENIAIASANDYGLIMTKYFTAD